MVYFRYKLYRCQLANLRKKEYRMKKNSIIHLLNFSNLLMYPIVLNSLSEIELSENSVLASKVLIISLLVCLSAFFFLSVLLVSSSSFSENWINRRKEKSISFNHFALIQYYMNSPSLTEEIDCRDELTRFEYYRESALLLSEKDAAIKLRSYRI